MKKSVTLYNVLFPFWMLMLFPITWLFVLPGNFLIDSVVLIILMAVLKLENRKKLYWKKIFPAFAFGLLADAIGSAFMFVMIYFAELGQMGDEWYLTVPGLLISAVCIFIFDYFVTFRDQPDRRAMALTFAIATAPYTFLIPSAWLYGGM